MSGEGVSSGVPLEEGGENLIRSLESRMIQLAEHVGDTKYMNELAASLVPDCCLYFFHYKNAVFHAESKALVPEAATGLLKECLASGAESATDEKGCFLALPLRNKERIVSGVVVHFPNEFPGFESVPVLLLRHFLRFFLLLEYSRRLQKKLDGAAVVDPLTGLYNRPHMEAALERISNMARRQNISVGILMMDIDHFRPFVDSEGREAGDSFLREVAEIIKPAIRVEDIACRYGNDKFAVILPGIDPRSALDRAGLLLEKIRCAGPASLTASAGICVFFREDSWQDALKMADEALEEAKRLGRDRVHLAE